MIQEIFHDFFLKNIIVKIMRTFFWDMAVTDTRTERSDRHAFPQKKFN